MLQLPFRSVAQSRAILAGVALVGVACSDPEVSFVEGTFALAECLPSTLQPSGPLPCKFYEERLSETWTDSATLILARDGSLDLERWNHYLNRTCDDPANPTCQQVDTIQ